MGWIKVEPSAESLHLLSYLCAVDHCHVQLEASPCEDELFRVVQSACPMYHSTSVAVHGFALRCFSLRFRYLFNLAITNTCNQTSSSTGVFSFLSIKTFILSRISVCGSFSAFETSITACYNIRTDIRYTLPYLRPSSVENIKFGPAMREGLTNWTKLIL